ncbi:MAG: aldo/keto reductase [Woeseiaceae bacterium]|nr:aldo/keto reductase [Woeseiaceae bacterium]
MRYVRLGKSNLDVSRLGLDCSSLGVPQRDRGWDPLSYDGEVFATRTVHAALDAGINFFDTSPDAGGGRGEALLGKALQGRSESIVLASRVYTFDNPVRVEQRIEASLRRLRTEHLDILYLSDQPENGRSFKELLASGQLEPVVRLRERGIIGHFGLLVSDPAQAPTILDSGLFDVAQMQYNVTEPGDAQAALDSCSRSNLGISVVKPLATRTLQTIVDALDPDWNGAPAARECCLRFLLGDRRVHSINVGMRWEHEVITHSRLVAGIDPLPAANPQVA